ncbi:hypothetical protein DOTSEDRAFT_75213 [Dothistroma septosporum NZE10]|uniref:Uncharacterized protein n=1 Tax=Dothistroma septosporum (strain NZE10 / CBS 128990) TaxID=675120 RepID=M2YKG9_DOTSN|nr:hypothetical protein DOTSEDRAFT_75213 [Dothistroma septosporum NZE10]
MHKSVRYVDLQVADDSHVTLFQCDKGLPGAHGPRLPMLGGVLGGTLGKRLWPGRSSQGVGIPPVIRDVSARRMNAQRLPHPVHSPAHRATETAVSECCTILIDMVRFQLGRASTDELFRTSLSFVMLSRESAAKLV